MADFWKGVGEGFARQFERSWDASAQEEKERKARERVRKARDEGREYQEEQDALKRERVERARRNRMIAAIGAATPEARKRYIDAAPQQIPFTGTQREGVMQTALAQDTGVTPPPLPMQTQDWQADQDAIRMDIAERQLGKAEADIGRETTSDRAFEDFKRRARATTEEGIARSLRILREVNPEQFQQQLEQQMAEWEALSPHRKEAYNQSMSLFKDKALFNLDLAGKADDAGRAGMLGELLGRQGIRWGKDGKDVIRRLSEAGHDIEDAAIVSAAQKSNAEGISLFEKSSYEEKKVALMELATAWPLLNATSATPRSFEFFREVYRDAGLTADIDANEDILRSKFAIGTVSRRVRDEGAERADRKRKALKLEEKEDWLKVHGFGVEGRLRKIFEKRPVPVRDPSSLNKDVAAENRLLTNMRDGGYLDREFKPTEKLSLYFKENPSALVKWELYFKETGRTPSPEISPDKMLQDIKEESSKTMRHVNAAITKHPRLDVDTERELVDLLTNDKALTPANRDRAMEKFGEVKREVDYKVAVSAAANAGEQDIAWRILVGNERVNEDYILVPSVVGGRETESGWVPPQIRVTPRLHPRFFENPDNMSEESQRRMQQEIEKLERAGSDAAPRNLEGGGTTPGGNSWGDVREENDPSSPQQGGRDSTQPMEAPAAPADYKGKEKPSDTRLVKRKAIERYKAAREKLGERKDITERKVKALSDYLFQP